MIHIKVKVQCYALWLILVTTAETRIYIFCVLSPACICPARTTRICSNRPDQSD